MEHTDSNVDSRITALEMKVAFLEDFLTQVQEVTVKQGDLVERLQTENRLMRDKIKEMADQLDGDIPNVRPPHY